jgi:hydrogenase nickel incorporation protein HypB
MSGSPCFVEVVCPSSYDFGEDLRFGLLFTTEGEDKSLKYPTIFDTTDVALLTKMDMADAGVKVSEVSAKTGEGMDAMVTLMRTNLEEAQKSSTLPTGPA